MATVLLVDDEPAILQLLAACCEEAGHEPLTASDGREAFRLFFRYRPDLVVADVRMPEMDGFELLSRIREVSEVPVLILSALGTEEEKVRGLRLGADDYIVKPVGLKELVARMEAALRRAQLPSVGEGSTYRDGLLTINQERREVRLGSQKIDLTPTEFRLLSYLTQHAGRVVSVRELLQHVWGSLHHSEDVVKWHIAAVRRKVEANPTEPRLIITVRGSGYRYDPPYVAAANGGYARARSV